MLRRKGAGGLSQPSQMHNQREHRTPPAQTHALRQCDLPCFPPRHRQPPPSGQPGPSRARLPSACRPSGRQPRATGTHREVLALLGRPDQTAWTGLVTQLHPSQIERDLAEETCPQLVPRAPLGALPPPCPAPAARLPSSHTTPSRRRLRTRSLSRRRVWTDRVAHAQHRLRSSAAAAGAKTRSTCSLSAR